jgi:large subunit ribosomal protein L10
MRQEKQLLLDEIKHQIGSSKAFIITRYHQLRAVPIAEFRRSVTKAGGNFEVVRKRVFIKAAEAAGITLKEDALEGHVGILFTRNDPIEMTKVTYQFIKDHPDALHVLAGRFDDKTYSATDVEKLSKLPGIQEMRAQLLGLFEAPMAQTLSVMEALLTSVMHCLENKSQKEQTRE